MPPCGLPDLLSFIPKLTASVIWYFFYYWSSPFLFSTSLPLQKKSLRHPHTYVCTDEWCPTASTCCPSHCPLNFPRNKAQVHDNSHLCLNQSSNGPSTENFQTILVAISNATCIVLWHRLAEERRSRKKERKKITNPADFWQFQVCHFKIGTTYHCKNCSIKVTPKMVWNPCHTGHTKFRYETRTLWELVWTPHY